MTQLEKARNGIITREMKIVSRDEGISAETVRKNVANGTLVIPANINHIKNKNFKPCGIGKNLRTKVNVNIGTSEMHCNPNEELKKLKISLKYKADTIMDLSTGGNLDNIRKEIIKSCPIPLGTVPIYQVMVQNKNPIKDVSIENLLEVIEKHGRDGVDFITVHCSVKKAAIPLLKRRLTGVVSRGGSFLVKWMKYHKKENPLYTHFDEILRIAKKYDMTISLGDGLRPGSIADATDAAQIHELRVSGELVKKCWKAKVQVMVEGPGHIPLHQIEKNIKMQKKICNNAPFYVLGPLVTDIAPGYDHLTSAIGGALAAFYGADFLCYVTPAEHLKLPSVEDVKEGLIASRIAAHAADIARGIDTKWDREMSKYRKVFNWKKQTELAIDTEKARKYRKASESKKDVCTMCGRFCAMKNKMQV